MTGIEGETPSSEPDWVDSLTEEERIERLKLKGLEPINAPPELKGRIMEDYRFKMSIRDIEIIV